LTWKRTIIREEQLPPPRFAQEGFLALGHPPKAACPVPPLKEAQLPGHLHLTAKLACDRHILTVVSASWTCNCKPTHLGVGPTCAVVRDLWSRIDVLPFPQNIWHLLGYLGLRSLLVSAEACLPLTRQARVGILMFPPNPPGLKSKQFQVVES